MPAWKTELKPEPGPQQSPELAPVAARLMQALAVHEPERQRWR
jgi:hypothetical protein